MADGLTHANSDATPLPELCDVYDEAGQRTGRTVPRGTELPPGEYYLVVHVWMRNEAGEYLVQQRAWHLASAAGAWATTVGYAQAGEDSRSAAMREVMEELGVPLSPGNLRRFDHLKTGNRIEDLWLAEVPDSVAAILKPGAEVADWRWASKLELIHLAGRGDFFAYSYLSGLPE